MSDRRDWGKPKDPAPETNHEQMRKIMLAELIDGRTAVKLGVDASRARGRAIIDAILAEDDKP